LTNFIAGQPFHLQLFIASGISLAAFHCGQPFSLQASPFHWPLFIALGFSLAAFIAGQHFSLPLFMLLVFHWLLFIAGQLFSLDASHCRPALFIGHFSLLLVFSLAAFIAG